MYIHVYSVSYNLAYKRPKSKIGWMMAYLVTYNIVNNKIGKPTVKFLSQWIRVYSKLLNSLEH